MQRKELKEIGEIEEIGKKVIDNDSLNGLLTKKPSTAARAYSSSITRSNDVTEHVVDKK